MILLLAGIASAVVVFVVFYMFAILRKGKRQDGQATERVRRWVIALIALHAFIFVGAIISENWFMVGGFGTVFVLLAFELAREVLSAGG